MKSSAVKHMYVIYFPGQTVIGPFWSIDAAAEYRDTYFGPDAFRTIKIWAVERPEHTNPSILQKKMGLPDDQ